TVYEHRTRMQVSIGLHSDANHHRSRRREEADFRESEAVPPPHVVGGYGGDAPAAHFLQRSPKRGNLRHELCGMNRRHFLQATVASMFCSPLALRAKEPEATNSPPTAASLPPSQRYKIGVCDWMILKRQKLGAFQLTKDIGADGVEVDMGGLGERETFDNQLANPATAQQFLGKA